MKKGAEKKEKMFSFQDIVEKELERFSKRTQDIVKSRFGMHEEGKPMTLDAIGKRYGVTRERIRQIVRQVLRDFGKKSEAEVRAAIETLESVLRRRGGIVPKHDLYRHVGHEHPLQRGAIDLLLEHSDRFSVLDRDMRYHPAIALTDFDENVYNEIADVAFQLFEKERRPFLFEEIYKALSVIRPEVLEKDHVESYLGVNARLGKNPFGHWGLLDWPEISPKSTRDKAYLVLKYRGEPMHFRAIAEHIDTHGLGKGRKTNPQTVHNELIKDSVFSLVGRGMYGLREWGHEGGTVRKTIEKILREAKRPMTRREIYDAVLAEKRVKATTILVNLNMHFKRIGKDTYTLSENVRV